MFSTATGLWVLDETQPVALVLDPGTGAVRRSVSWAEVPPPPPGRSAVVRADADALWVQHHRSGPLARVLPGGLDATVWTDGLTLAAAGATSAWCTSPTRPQELVRGTDAAPLGFRGSGVLLRADADGRVQTVSTDTTIASLWTSAEALWVQLNVEPWSLRGLGADVHEVQWCSRWVALPWSGNLPSRVLAADGQAEVPNGAVPAVVGHGCWSGHAYDPDSSVLTGEAVQAADLLWRLGTTSGGRGSTATRRVVAVATPFEGNEGGGEPARVIELDVARPVAAAPVGHRLAVLAHGHPAATTAPRLGAQLLVLDADTGQVQGWLSGAVDITSGCWPLRPRPVDADSYTRLVLARWSRLATYWETANGPRPLSDGMSDSVARLVGDWPSTHLECTFDHAARPGVRLRRRIDLFDELGAIADPEFATVHLMEALDTLRLPPVEDARGGILDV